jgi:hypothetical protein
VENRASIATVLIIMVEPVFNDECECDANVRDDKKKPKE